MLPDDDEATLLERLHAAEHRLLPGAVAALLAGALSVEPGARRARFDAAAFDAHAPVPRRALLSAYDKAGLAAFGAGLVARGFELVSTGGTARALREAGLPVTDVVAVTGFPEMLDGRVKTLDPHVHAGLLADRRRADHREAIAAAGIAPFELVVVNLYPFAEAARRPGIAFDDLVEEIDIGGPSMVRAAAKNHASVAIVTTPERYDAVLAALDEHGEIPLGLRSALAVEAFAHTAAYDARIAAELPCRMRDARGRPPARARPARRRGPVSAGADDLDGQGRHAPLRREPAPAGRPLPPHGPRAARRGGPVRGRRAAAPGQGAQLQQRARRVRRGLARAAAARPRRRHRQAHQPVRRGRASDAPRGLGRGPRGRPGVGVRRRRRRHGHGGPRARRAAGLDLPRGRRRAGLRRRRARGPRGQAQPAPRRGRVARRVGGPDGPARSAACSTSTGWARCGRRVARCS